MFHSLSNDAYKRLDDYPVIVYGLAISSFGETAVAWWPLNDETDAVCYLSLQSDLQRVTDRLHALFPHNRFTRDDRRAKRFVKQLESGSHTGPILMKGSSFFLQVWETLYNTKRGQTLSYGQLAKLAGRPLASRAVGRAMATNPVALILPCHRVLSSTGLGGYGYGPEVKKRLLAREKE
jgi:AraC family transcriptional regulator of adaptative response/methylated-DNA-[protein]-cysteine methyltransferase